ncbi:ABC transporter ATP-binding protein [Rothia sp. P7208]|uniref:ABC transporter ATP-binding protein n=1 Tax=Rothia sp. P7208 TaxID=3402660 RepID=UPI003ABE2826
MDIQNLSKSFGSVKALDSVSFSTPTDATVAVIGHNGSGKTTLLEIIMGIQQPSEGKIDLSAELSSAPLKEKIGVVLQKNNFYESATALELLRLFSTYYSGPVLPIDDLVDLLDMRPFINKRYGALSGGMQQKVNLALAFLNDPAVVVLDEPTTGLDPLARLDFWTTLRDLCRGRLVLVSSHYMSEVQENCTHLVHLDRGKLRYAGQIDSLLEQTGAPDLNSLYIRIAQESRSAHASRAAQD